MGRPLFPSYTGAVPVLLYHRVYPGRARDGGTAAFALHMRRLHRLGFEAITLDKYVRFVRGETVDLPRRPILITFDDGYVSALRTADPVLAEFGWSAVMYLPTGTVGWPGRLTWDELREMRSTGRWAIEEHAGDGHVLIPVDVAGRRRPFYANERWSDGTQETFAEYKRRVSGDLEHGAATLARRLAGWVPGLSFAVPFGDYGQRGSNDPRIEPWFRSYLTSRFSVVFVQQGDGFTTAGGGLANRITVSSSWSPGALEAHLRRGLRSRVAGRPQ